MPNDSESAEAAGNMRIAVEGCGHGTLDAIYASVLKACAVKGWDGVDLLIIGGDFQAVRDRRDLNVTAMPAKYRTMADFHQYYWGKKTAPFLTIFVGGNHEASNHLYELYYGGWVAPNIYYLGAANVIQVGPLKIAGLSGIWKGYDYRKPHYERLPYSFDDMYSIYHVRELDVRKLLSFRSQVDVGISHDWPKGIEWLGDHNRLFKHKMHLREDAKSGQLGSTAAQKVMDHLRPPYWFSAHLHTKYAALKIYRDKLGIQEQVSRTRLVGTAASRHGATAQALVPHQEQLSAWNSFGARARQEEAADIAKMAQEETARRERAGRAGLPLSASYVIDETYKRIKVENGMQRSVTASYQEERDDSQHEPLSSLQLDGCCASLPLKRRRAETSSSIGTGLPGGQYTILEDTQAGGLAPSSPAGMIATNPDAIDIDMSDEEAAPLMPTSAAGNDHGSSLDVSLMSNLSQQGRDETVAVAAKSNQDNDVHDRKKLANDDTWQNNQASTAGGRSTEITSATGDIRFITDKDSAGSHETVSEEMRAQLAALSSKFDEPVHISPSLPHPSDISNETTRFLALSKSEDKQNFLQLLEIHPYEHPSKSFDRPFHLSYVPEWLAILKTFASELSLGGSPRDTIPQHRGDTFYRNQILENEKWIQENVVTPGLVRVPENFVTTVNYSDPDETVETGEMPREVTNPQTTLLCKLIGIPNLFDISEEERDARVAAGLPQRPEADRPHRGNKHGGRAGHGGRGGRGGRSGYRSRGGRGSSSRGRGSHHS